MSYNSLFGLGTHAGNVNRQNQWDMQDNAANTTVANAIQSDGSLQVNNTADRTVTGPTAWLPAALNLGGDDAVNLVTAEAFRYANNDDYTLMAWVKVDGTDEAGYIFNNTDSTTTGTGFYWDGANDRLTNTRGTSTSNGAHSSAVFTESGTWVHAAVVSDWSTSPEYTFYKNGVAAGSDSLATTPTTSVGSGFSRIGRRQGSTAATVFLDAHVAQAVDFDAALTASEIAEVYAGPEPLNLVAPVVSQTATKISTTDGSWDSQANGTITYTYQWEVADDASGTNAENRGVLNAMYPKRGDNGKYVRVTIAAANDGGIDDAETQTTAWTLITADVPAEGKTAVVNGTINVASGSTADITAAGFGTIAGAIIFANSTTTSAEEEKTGTEVNDASIGVGFWSPDEDLWAGFEVNSGANGDREFRTDTCLYHDSVIRCSGSAITDGLRLTVVGSGGGTDDYTFTAILFDENCFFKAFSGSPATDVELEFPATGSLATTTGGTGSNVALLSMGAVDQWGQNAGWTTTQLPATPSNYVWMDTDFMVGQYSSGIYRTWYTTGSWSNANYTLNRAGTGSGFDSVHTVVFGNVGMSVSMNGDPGANQEETYKAKGVTEPETAIFINTVLQDGNNRSTGAEAGYFGFGIDDMTTSRTYGYMFDEADGLDDSVIYDASDSQVCWVSLGGGTHIKNKEANVSDFGNGALTLDYTTGTGTARKFAAITFGSLAPAEPSYNWMFGVGKWADSGIDPRINGWWKMDDDAASTDMLDYSGLGLDATLAANSDTMTQATNDARYPKGLLQPSCTLTGAELDSGVGLSICCRVELLDLVSQTGQAIFKNGGANVWRLRLYDDRVILFSGTQSTELFSVAINEPFAVSGHDFGAGNNQYAMFDDVDPTDIESSGTGTNVYSSSQIVCPANTILFDMVKFKHAIPLADTKQWVNSFEPTSDGPPITSGTFEVGQVVSVSDPNFDLHNNGTGVYTYQWYTADDTAGTNPVVISGATSSSYTIQAGDDTKYLGCFVTATNDGGNDPVEDTYSTFTLVTSGGGGPTFEPFWAIHATVIIQ